MREQLKLCTERINSKHQTDIYKYIERHRHGYEIEVNEVEYENGWIELMGLSNRSRGVNRKFWGSIALAGASLSSRSTSGAA
ncbi:hypothetical protein MUU53_22445 [Rhizobium lemnae]|uniref:Uncharacterized protein n=1 Tax=Rhizobium lemnae TaxID=1214924 RepID=A0ABV8E713_9HYPH|nr:hypothetical protein [Rhizobium lemnae]MCJ8510621.1 hypothetical protein [Rhizobium lemnae]